MRARPRFRRARCTGLEAGGRWALQFPAKPALKFAAVLRGRCWIALPGEAPCRLTAGDTFLLANAPAYRLASDLGQPVGDGYGLFERARSTVARYGGDETVLLGGSFAFEGGVEGGHADLLLDALPRFVHVPATAPATAILRGTLRLLDAELDAAQIGAALGMMHHEPGRGWTVGALASAVAMSRSGFALRFKALVGVPPLEYLRRWRMVRARAALRGNAGTVAGLAATLGYASESAFGHAFKRVFGQAPTRYRPGKPALNTDGGGPPT